MAIDDVHIIAVKIVGIEFIYEVFGFLGILGRLEQLLYLMGFCGGIDGVDSHGAGRWEQRLIGFVADGVKFLLNAAIGTGAGLDGLYMVFFLQIY